MLLDVLVSSSVCYKGSPIPEYTSHDRSIDDLDIPVLPDFSTGNLFPLGFHQIFDRSMLSLGGHLLEPA